jgi:peptidoglycan hydrolase-like protein with peptidoglycan-binding domain
VRIDEADRDFAQRWLASRRRARRRRAEEARARTRRRMSGRGLATVVAVMALGAGAATAAQTGGAAPTAARTVLRVGSSGTAVQALQRALGVAADGAYGPLTARAVRRFQRAHGIRPNGVAGAGTLAALGISAPAAAATAAPSAALARIALCESGGNPAAVSPDGRYRGKYQFTRATWRALGGSGDPAKAPEVEQDRRAAALYAAQGTAPWPVCGAA